MASATSSLPEESKPARVEARLQDIHRGPLPRRPSERPRSLPGRQGRVRRARLKPRKLAVQPELHGWVQDRLGQRWSPQQISRSLPSLFPDQVESRVATETIYQALYVQGRGELRRELTRALRTGRTCRRPRRRATQRSNRYATPMVMISDRPPEADDRAVPGHWESQCCCQAA